MSALWEGERRESVLTADAGYLKDIHRWKLHDYMVFTLKLLLQFSYNYRNGNDDGLENIQKSHAGPLLHFERTPFDSLGPLGISHGTCQLYGGLSKTIRKMVEASGF